MSQPVILYVDDEPNNLTVFEASMPAGWVIKLADGPVQALNSLNDWNPWVIISDQRMPTMKGVEFLHLAKRLLPQAVRIIVTGYSDEDLIIESVRKAQVFDYLRKPWEPENLEIVLQRAIDHFALSRERDEMIVRLQDQTLALEERNRTLEQIKSELEKSEKRETLLRQELECWVPPFVRHTLKDASVTFPMRRDLVGITFDIVGSGKIHDHSFQGRPLRARVLGNFSEAILRNGGFRESHAGDSAYAHFGLMGEAHSYGEAALSAAREFRVSLRSLASMHGYPIECGIALHAAKNTVVDIHTVQLHTAQGLVTQKSFDTTSSEIDVLHRIEKLTHRLPGTNIILTRSFLDLLGTLPQNMKALGLVRIDGYPRPLELFLLPSDMVSQSVFEKFLESLDRVSVRSLVEEAA